MARPHAINIDGLSLLKDWIETRLPIVISEKGLAIDVDVPVSSAIMASTPWIDAQPPDKTT